MGYDPDRHHRRSTRLRGYDYARPGAYYVTIVVQGRELRFGMIDHAAMHLNDAGRMIEHWWKELEPRYATVRTDSFVVMPNHVHGVLHLLEDEGGHAGPPLHRVVGWFKTMTTNGYLLGVKAGRWPPFEGRLWQRGYYERIVRNESELARTRDYIAANPLRWSDDAENPAAGLSLHPASDDLEALLGGR
jgi:REP element-mobilizing transposase RayT